MGEGGGHLSCDLDLPPTVLILSTIELNIIPTPAVHPSISLKITKSRTARPYQVLQIYFVQFMLIQGKRYGKTDDICYSYL